MSKKLEVEWSTGPNITGCYSGTESITFNDSDEINVYEWEEKLLRRAADKLCWKDPLKRIKTTLSKG